MSKTEVSQNWNVTSYDMSLKFKCQQNIKSPILKWQKNWNFTKQLMSPKLKHYQKWNITKTKNYTETDIRKMECHQNWSVIKFEITPKLNRHQNWNVTNTERSPKLKYHQNWYATKTEIPPFHHIGASIRIGRDALTGICP